jgi:hypothetical protein
VLPSSGMAGRRLRPSLTSALVESSARHRNSLSVPAHVPLALWIGWLPVSIEPSNRTGTFSGIFFFVGGTRRLECGCIVD